MCSDLFVVGFRIISSGQMKMQRVYGCFRPCLSNQRPAVSELGEDEDWRTSRLSLIVLWIFHSSLLKILNGSINSANNFLLRTFFTV